MFSLREIVQLRKSFKLVRARKKKANSLRKALRESRERNVGDEGLLEEAVRNLSSNGIRVFTARDKEEALGIIREEVGGSEVVVKSKSNVTKELGVTSHLEALGKTVVETDIGDRLLQITGGKPSHPTGPASHLAVPDIIDALRAYFGREIGDTPEEIVEVIRQDLLSYIEKADVAITGANAIAAEEGSILILHNEANISEIIQRTGKLIVLTGIDKLYRDLEEAMRMVKAVTFNATGTKVPSFINIISGPSKTADIEKKLIFGVHSPREIVLVLLDGGRKRLASGAPGGEGGAARGAFKEILYCIGCGSCLIYCPMYNVVGDRFGLGESLGGRGLILSYALGGNRDAAHAARMCLGCFHCRRECPVDINIPGMIWRMRKLEGRNNLVDFLFSKVIYLANLLRVKRFEFGINRR